MNDVAQAISEQDIDRHLTIRWKLRLIYGALMAASGPLFTMGRFRPVDEGWIVNGHWRYASDYCTYLVAGA
jgi:hypothetical protein